MQSRLRLLALALILGLVITNVSSAERRRKHRRRTTTEAPFQPEVMNLLKEEDTSKEKLVAKMDDQDSNSESGEHDNSNEPKDGVLRMDPCLDKHCGAGRVCRVNDLGAAECVCIEVCDEEKDPRRKVCTNYNETFGSDCEVYQARCFCDSGDSRCRGPDYQHVHIEYYGECRQMPMCKEEDMMDFPRRMRDWLFNIMRDMADRQELPTHFLKMQREAETNLTLRWTNAAIWKWCDLDGHPHDRAVSRHELFPIRAPLMALEHCIAPFLDGCDENNDHKINLVEWGKCLQLDEDDLDDKCDELEEAGH
ncbi:Similar to ost-1: SPARC (Caenorhabditis elegans) [Cotesia congregata]|uniref:Similar to ost-1: SPARC (Caenorhabditis elegans) n=1 Tax=Cotesia congregata TaxID=51543 RepID=A0A8J2E3E5_COTCN|nr:Similar to ost-1: SPARC (Caenorhabditis elegans) [Cotesia congregata]